MLADHNTATIVSILETLRKLAATGKNYAKSEYDTIRYSEILATVEALYKKLSTTDIIEIDPIETTGYITPKIRVNGIVENKKGEILLERRSDDKSWGIPGGWAEVGLSPEENVKKEMLEETGLKVEIDHLVGIMNRKPDTTYPFTSYHILYKCKIVSGSLKKSYESIDLGWHSCEKLTNWHHDHKAWMQYYKKH